MYAIRSYYVLRSMTQGRAHHARSVAGYEPVPDHLAQKIAQAREEEAAEAAAH